MVEEDGAGNGTAGFSEEQVKTLESMLERIVDRRLKERGSGRETSGGKAPGTSKPRGRRWGRKLSRVPQLGAGQSCTNSVYRSRGSGRATTRARTSGNGRHQGAGGGGVVGPPPGLRQVAMAATKQQEGWQGHP